MLTGIASCSVDKGKNIPDVSHISAEAKITRFEKKLFALDTTQLANELAALEQAHPEFSGVYFPNVLGISKRRLGEEKYVQTVNGFLIFPAVRKLYDTTLTIYPDLQWLEKDLSSTFRYYKYYFPENPTPRVYTYISEYAYGAFVGDGDILGIGLDFFFGADYPYYNPAYFPNYIKRHMDRKHMVMRAVEALVDDLCGPPKGERLLDRMVHNGKKLYLMDQLLPYTPDSVRLAYTSAQTQWCENNELQMWNHFLTEELLYSTDYRNIRKLVEHSPNSPKMPPEAPGRTANYMGWQIVKSYMKRFPQTSMQELIEMKDAQQLLEQSRYKPRR
ncbi:MAG: hypothetical protein AAGG75_02655 [Bacteroidota bacterium]